MSIRDKEWLKYALLVAAILVAGYFGARFPLPEMPEAMTEIGMQAVGPTRFRSIQVDHDVNVDGASTSADLTCSGTVSAEQLTTTDDLTVTDDAGVGGDLTVTGATNLDSTLDIDGNITSGTGAITITDSVNITGAVDCDSTLNVDGAATFVSTVSVGGDVTFENGTTLGEAVNTVADFSEFLAFTEQTIVVVTAGSTITPTGTYQPITSTAFITTSTSYAIADGVVNGQLLVLINENASDMITIDDGANTKLGGDKQLNGGEGDAIWLIWDGSDWLCIGYNDN